MPTGRADFDGPMSLVYRMSPKGRAGSTPAPAAGWLGFQLAPCPSSPFDGSQDWVIVHNDAVAGSNPASGSICRSSSVVEHVNPQSISYPSFLSAGRRGWVIGTEGGWFESALAPGASCSTGWSISPISYRPLPARLSDGPKLWVIACYWFESNGRLQMPA